MAKRQSRHKTVSVDIDARTTVEPTLRQWPWWVTAVGGALAVLAAGWVLLAAATLIGSLSAPGTETATALGLATRMLLLAHGAPVVIGGQSVTLVPLTLTLLLLMAGVPVTSLAARQLAAVQAVSDDTGRLWVDGQSLVVRVAATYSTAYVGAVVVFGSMTVGGGVWRGVAGALAVAVVSGLWGASRAIGHDPRRGWPTWLRSAPVALGATLLVCIAAGAIALTAALVAGRDKAALIATQLQPDAIGVVLLVLLQLLYLPNLVLWGTAWTLGAGVTLGDGSLLNLNVTDVGFLPAFPVLGAVPNPGLTPPATLWWLLSGVAAGALVVLVLLPGQRRLRFDRSALAGAVLGLAAGLLVALACSLGSGGLGAERLAHMGPRTTDLFVVAPSLLGLSGLVTGLVVGLVRRPSESQ